METEQELINKKLRAAAKIDNGMKKNRYKAAAASIYQTISASMILDFIKKGIGSCTFGFRSCSPHLDSAMLMLLVQLARRFGIKLVMSERQFLILHKVFRKREVEIFITKKVDGIDTVDKVDDSFQYTMSEKDAK